MRFICIQNLHMVILLFIFPGALYYSLGNIDPAMWSKTESIFLLCLLPYQLLDSYSFDAVMKPFLDDLTNLNEVSLYSH